MRQFIGGVVAAVALAGGSASAATIDFSAGLGRGDVGVLPFGFDFEIASNGQTWLLSEHPEAVISVNGGRKGGWIIEAAASVGGADWDLNFEVSDAQVPTSRGPGQASIASAFTVTNNNAGVSHFTVTTLQAAFVSPGPTEILGSTSGNVGDNPMFGDGATLSAFAGSAMYDAQIDGLSVQTLFNDPFSVSAVPFLTNSYGPSDFGWTGGQSAVFSDIRIINDFTLTGFDNAGMTSTFIVRVPSQGSMALLGLSGLVAIRRRRGER